MCTARSCCLRPSLWPRRRADAPLPRPTDDLRRDLELARAQGLELAPRGAGQSTVSAAELIPRASKASPSSAVRTPPRAVVSAAKPKAPVIVDAPVAPDPVRPQPSSAKPAMNPEPRGGYKSMGDLIRKAPFPINPVRLISQF